MLERELNPLHRQALERSHELARELGWDSYREMYEELKQIDLGALERQTSAFLRDDRRALPRARSSRMCAPRSGSASTSCAAPTCRTSSGRRDSTTCFPRSGSSPALEQTLAASGSTCTRSRTCASTSSSGRAKSPRAFCAPVSVPDEVYLVIARHGGRDDYAALFHEAGHTEHYANVEASLPFEFRHLGDNSVTEGFAFLFEHLTEDPVWLRAVLGAEDADRLAAYTGFTRASKFVFLRRYAAKLSYELELHGGERPLDEMPALYSRLLGDAVGVEWPRGDLPRGRGRGLLRGELPARMGVRDPPARRAASSASARSGSARREAGDLLRELWREGQRLDADELLAQVTGERLDFGVMKAR